MHRFMHRFMHRWLVSRLLSCLFAFTFLFFGFYGCFCSGKFSQRKGCARINVGRPIKVSNDKQVRGKVSTRGVRRFSNCYARKEIGFFNRYCKNSSSNVGILRYNFLNNKLTGGKDGAHAYIVFSPTYVVKMLGCKKKMEKIKSSFFEDICFELYDSKGNIYRHASGNCDGSYVHISEHGDCAVLNVLIKDRSKFSFEEGKPCKVRLFKGNSFESKNLFFEFNVKSQRATYNLFSRLGEITDFYREFAHPDRLDLDFYCS